MTLYTLARSLPPSRYRPGGGTERTRWLIGIAVLALLIGGLVVGPRRPMCSFTKGEIVRRTFERYTDVAYVSFRGANPSRPCPIDLYELSPWMYSNDIRDPWGTPYAMTCGVASIVVSSAGEDRKFKTSDDIRSNE